MRRLEAACIAGCVALVASTLLAHAASSSQEAFHRANAFYREGKYAEAVTNYQSILAGGHENGAIYYNLGNSYLKQQRLGYAVWAYSKAQHWLPRDPDVQANMTYARQLMASGSPTTVARPRLVRWMTLGGQYATQPLAHSASLLLWLALAGWMVCGWLPRARRVAWPAAWVLSVVALTVLLACLVQHTWHTTHPRAVAVTATEARFAPQTSATTHFQIDEGTTVTIRRSQSEWSQIQRGDGIAGWVRRQSLKEL